MELKCEYCGAFIKDTDANCPNCGAPLTSLGAKHCEYCGTPIIEYNIKAWTFSNIDEVN